MAQSQRKRTGSHLVGHRDLLAKLRAEFPQSRIQVSPLQRGECTLTVSGVNVRTIYERARVLACIAVLYNCAAFYNRQLSKTRWTQYASMSRRNRNHDRLQFRCGTQTINFQLMPIEQAVATGDFTLYLREV